MAEALHAHGAAASDLDTAYARYLAEARRNNPNGMPMSAADFERYSLGSRWLTGMKDVARKLVQTCRLMVGVHDYAYYLEHMRERHPEIAPMSREAFYRYCLEARFPSAGKSGSRCPC